MATLSNSQNTQNAAPAQGSPSTDGGNAFSKIAAGPAALAQLLIYQIMALYAEIIELDQKQKVSMVQAQSKEAQANADATIAGGNALLGSAIASGVLTLAGAVGGLLIQEGLSRTQEGKDAAEAESKAQLKVSDDKALEEALTQKPAGVQGGQANPQADANKVADRMEEFKRGDFSKAKENEANTKEAIRSMKADQNYNFKAFEEQFQENKIGNSRDYNSAVQRRSNLNTKIATFKGIVEQAGQAGSSVSNGIGSAKKAEQDANVALFSSASQMAGSASSDFGQGLNKAFESQNAEIQVLENINRTNSVSG